MHSGSIIISYPQSGQIGIPEIVISTGSVFVSSLFVQCSFSQVNVNSTFEVKIFNFVSFPTISCIN
jgi:hypothetical protein